MDTAPDTIKPGSLRAGDTVGIVAPSSPMFEDGQIEFTFAWLKKLGLKWKLGRHLKDHHGDLAGIDEARLEDFHEMWADKEVKAVFPIRGGNGSVRLLPHLDFELIRKNPKVLIGFSDITGLLIPINQKTGLITFHGPTAGSFFDSEYTFNNFKRALFDKNPIGAIEDPDDGDRFAPEYPPYRMVLKEGEGEGPLVGGCLTLIRQMMGTEYEINTDNKIFFFEDVGEEPHAIDQMVTQLLLAGKFDKVKGVVIGECFDCRPGKSRRSRLNINFSMERMLRERLSHLEVPVVYGMRFGHSRCKFTLPLGARARLKTDGETFCFDIYEACLS